MNNYILDEDIQDLVVHVSSRKSRKVKTMPFTQLVDIIASHLERRDDTVSEPPTPRAEEIQVLPIITSRQITLSFRPNSKGSVALEIDTDGVPVYIGFSKHGMKVSITTVYKGRKRSLNITSSAREILLPFSDSQVISVEMEAIYDGRNISISATLK